MNKRKILTKLFSHSYKGGCDYGDVADKINSFISTEEIDDERLIDIKYSTSTLSGSERSYIVESAILIYKERDYESEREEERKKQISLEEEMKDKSKFNYL